MAVSVVPVPLSRPGVAEAAAVMGRAVVDDPIFMHALPDPADRTSGVPLIMETFLRIGLTHGEVWATPAPIIGAAIWLGPAHSPLTEADRDTAGMREVAAAWGPAAFARLDQFRVDMGEASREFAAEPHWHLMWLCVEPDQQGRGIGSALVRQITRRADAEAVPCDLFTFVPRTVPLYEYLGFQVVKETILPRTGLHLWMMWRAPQA